ncbi:GNAT family N-acetyltransferase [Pyxidicoccus parkwayensis]|uniref:GNAT family N-acetyltransferase n=1 Tax=Pyxidicoccus parkwayensis TaxID=2813578 RepID=A0ABX7NQQ0_9BACT|nr:GNAT family N-acetyltransferase [Pyxidicoccus parkwaysis]QSQ20694.1 GNAT family N-acetyltransferase [Pyxidicoccus parkwaysis]
MFDPAPLLARISDAPDHVWPRGALLSAGARAIEWTDGRSALLNDDGEACIVGQPPRPQLLAFLKRLAPGTEVVLSAEDARDIGPVPGWDVEPVVVLVQQGPPQPPPVINGEVRLLETLQGLDLSHLSEDLAGELEDARDASPFGVVFADGLPVSFSYSGSATETWWDMSIDTEERWRRRGYASAAAHVLIEHMRARGKRTVWAAFESNTASLVLAARLGFTPVSRVVSLFREGSER